jgi:hypothetical protein
MRRRTFSHFDDNEMYDTVVMTLIAAPKERATRRPCRRNTRRNPIFPRR